MELGKIKSRNELVIFFNECGFKKGAEIGVGDGSFSEYIHEKIEDLQLLSVDPWIPYSMKTAKYRQTAIDRLAKYPGNRIVQKTRMEAVCCVPEQSLDFVYVDGAHTFDNVICDLVEWTKRVRPGGIVAGHDYMRRFHGLRKAVNIYTDYYKIHLYLTEKQKYGADKYISFYFEKK